MRTSKLLILICFVFALIVANQVSADETGECVANEAGECINPDAEQPAVEEEVVEDIKSDEPVVEEAEPPVSEEEAPVASETEEVQEESESAPEVEEEAPETTEEAPETTDEKEEEEAEVVEETPAQEAETVTATDSAKGEEKPAEEEENTPGCPSRSHVIACAAKYLDTNGNQFLERAELQAAIDKLPWFSRGILTILGSIDKMMAKCDVDGDDAIGLDYDMKNNGEACLATCFKRRAFKSAFFSDCEL